MIKLTKLNGDVFYLNPHLIERLEEKPDTVITMDSQIQYIVREKIDEILEKIINYRKNLGAMSQE
ncbi:MAG TPA: flagellar FlbD family protein [Spirochaetota bacterium]|nr:flagellar FlbD family protein [Spirochaetota bacterium]HPP03773.1 flagellar FlbD family protein [Spirochaetota bacterium]